MNIFDCDKKINVLDDYFDLNISLDSGYFYADTTLNDSFNIPLDSGYFYVDISLNDSLNIPFDSSYFYVDISLNDSFCGLNDLEVTIVQQFKAGIVEGTIEQLKDENITTGYLLRLGQVSSVIEQVFPNSENLIYKVCNGDNECDQANVTLRYNPAD